MGTFLLFYFFLLFLKEKVYFFYFFLTFSLSIWCLVGVRTYRKYAKFKFQKKIEVHFFTMIFKRDYSVITVWLQCDYGENELSLFLRNPDTFFDAFYCCRWYLFFRSCKTFSTTLICLMMIPKKVRFFFKETKISYVIVWMTLAIHRNVAKTQEISIQIMIAYENLCDYFRAGGSTQEKK